jgi:ascorbate-specific PTS system EIIC-type component UlaA
MRLLSSHSCACAIAAVGLSILMWTAASSAFAAPPVPAPTAQQTAPIGHRQPNASNVPAKVLRDEQSMEAEDTKLDKELNICRGC